MSDLDYKQAFTDIMHILNGSSYTQMEGIPEEYRKHWTVTICNEPWWEVDDEGKEFYRDKDGERNYDMFPPRGENGKRQYNL